MSNRVMIVGITGASGGIYGIRLLEVLSATKDVETHLIISRAGELTMEYETDRTVEDVRALADFSYETEDIGACLASGSFKRDGMIIIPCSMATMSAIALSLADDILLRAADVTLKEREKLVLVVRETPLHLGHIRNMERVTEIGGIIMPPVPSFYSRPKTIQDVVDHTVGKILDIFDIEHDLFPRWSGLDHHVET